jgi:3-oxoacyl-[acyl-carrier protein] reductase
VDPEALRAAISETVEGFGGLEVLVNAGTSHITPIEEFPLAEYDRILAVNVRAIPVATQAAVPHLGPPAIDREIPPRGVRPYSVSGP